MADALTQLGRILERPLRDPDCYQQALTHASYSHEVGYQAPHNERLEFLGDAVLDLIVADYLYDCYPQRPEGELSQMRAAVVCTPALATIAKRLALGEMLRLGQGEAASGGRQRSSVLANALEALIGAVYLIEGLDVVEAFVLKHFKPELDEAGINPLQVDYKTRLQELTQRKFHTEPRYQVTAESGPDHDKVFEVDVFIKREPAGRGQGATKKEAEQRAAKKALQSMTNQS